MVNGANNEKKVLIFCEYFRNFLSSSDFLLTKIKITHCNYISIVPNHYLGADQLNWLRLNG